MGWRWFGVALLLYGAVQLLDRLDVSVPWTMVLSLALVAIGTVMVLTARRGASTRTIVIGVVCTVLLGFSVAPEDIAAQSGHSRDAGGDAVAITDR